jgi:hypothetical protein
MRVPATDFGGAAVSRLICDNPRCGKPVILAWTGKQGTYHSNECLELMENNMTENAEAQTETPTPSPISAGTPATKKTTGKKTAAAAKKSTAAAKKSTAPAKKSAPTEKKAPTKKAGSGSNTQGRSSRWPREFVIHKTPTFKDHKYKGQSAKKMALIKEDMTVGQYMVKRRESGLGAGVAQLVAAEKRGFITVGKK